MRWAERFRDPTTADRLRREILRQTTRRWVLMDVCGGQTHNLLRYGIEQALETAVELIHGPGCPVCVTSAETLDLAQSLAMQPDVILASFGDMLRVPGSHSSLLTTRARGGNVQMVYSPLDAVALAAAEPGRQVVFLAVGFETTAPATALAILQAEQVGLQNFSVLVEHVRVLPAMEQIAGSEKHRIDAFLAAGHVCTVTGAAAYHHFADRYGVPVVITGFEPLDLLSGIQQATRLLERGEVCVENAYGHSVQEFGNAHARQLIERVYQPVDQTWRGLGEIPRGGYALRPRYQMFCARQRFAPPRNSPPCNATLCRSGEVLLGEIKPPECEHFGNRCTPESPLGAPMVSSEGACAAYYRYQSASPIRANRVAPLPIDHQEPNS